MQLPFTAERFYGVFRDYNTTPWPVQLFLLALAGMAVVLVMRPRRWSGVGVSAILAFPWAWMGLAHHLAVFTSISPPAIRSGAIRKVAALGGIAHRRATNIACIVHQSAPLAHRRSSQMHLGMIAGKPTP